VVDRGILDGRAHIDLRGRLLRCDIGTVSLRPNENARLIHDGRCWQLWELTSNTRLAYIHGDDVESIQVIDSTRLERRTPDWAMALGIALLLCFLIGVVFFFAKETVRVQAAVVELTLTTGEVVAVEVWNEPVAKLQEALRT
jgi:hypothetical protein